MLTEMIENAIERPVATVLSLAGAIWAVATCLAFVA
jgi:hypothetical protein